MISCFYRIENIVEKGESAGNQHFLLSLHCFSKLSSLGLFGEGLTFKRTGPDISCLSKIGTSRPDCTKGTV